MEANDALDEFLNLALDYERRETPSLQGFLAWLRQARAEVKRDMEIARDEVRVMTVHGAKGLEAPIVDSRRHHDAARRAAASAAPDALRHGAMIWAGRKADDAAAVAAARQDCARRGRARISPAPLCRHDARRRPADRLRRGRRKEAARLAAGTISFATPLEPFLIEESDGDRQSLALSQDRELRRACAAKSIVGDDKAGAARAAVLAAAAGRRLTRRALHRYRRPPPLRKRSAAPPAPALPPSSARRRSNAAGSCIG